ncbi:MAG TPA: hypothetical protein VKA18_08255 [Alphaproteobacteria bacterium]|nr:hypothetical protein [Alphaproteobacteria bacterium]
MPFRAYEAAKQVVQGRADIGKDTLDPSNFGTLAGAALAAMVYLSSDPAAIWTYWDTMVGTVLFFVVLTIGPPPRPAPLVVYAGVLGIAVLAILAPFLSEVVGDLIAKPHGQANRPDEQVRLMESAWFVGGWAGFVVLFVLATWLVRVRHLLRR